MPNDPSGIQLDSITERIGRHRDACGEFLDARQRRLQLISSELFEHLSALDNQHSEWEDHHREADKLMLGVKKERTTLERDKADLESQLLEIEERTLETATQRRKIARKLREEKERLRASSDEQQELQDTVDSLRGQLKDYEKQSAELEDELTQIRQREDELKEKAKEGIRVANERGKQLKVLREQLQEGGSADNELIGQLQAERDELAEKINNLEAERTNHESTVDEDAIFEMQHEIERLKRSNEALKLELQSSHDSFEVDDPDASDWEKRKRQLLRELGGDDSNFDESESSQLNEAILKTDRVIEAKDAQIADLKEKLEQVVAMVEANQREEAEKTELNDDARIQVEQDRLRELQDEWKEKLRQTEVELAVQRAEFARQKSQLEEKARDVEAQLALAKKQTALQSAESETKKKKGWLGR